MARQCGQKPFSYFQDLDFLNPDPPNQKDISNSKDHQSKSDSNYNYFIHYTTLLSIYQTFLLAWLMLEKYDVISLISERTYDLTTNPHEIYLSDGEYLGNITHLDLLQVFDPKEFLVQPSPFRIPPPCREIVLRKIPLPNLSEIRCCSNSSFINHKVRSLVPPLITETRLLPWSPNSAVWSLIHCAGGSGLG
jgi:hypothetical protein